MVIAKPKPPGNRNILITLREDKLLKLVELAKAENYTTHEFVEELIERAIE